MRALILALLLPLPALAQLAAPVGRPYVNLVLQSMTLSAGAAATAPWSAATSTITTTAGGFVDGVSNWTEVTGNTASDGIFQVITSPAATQFFTRVFAYRASGSANTSVSVRCGGVPTSCACISSAGCTTQTGGASPNDCTARATVAQTPVNFGVNVICPAAITGPILILYPGDVGNLIGTTRFGGVRFGLGVRSTATVPLVKTTTAPARSTSRRI